MCAKRRKAERWTNASGEYEILSDGRLAINDGWEGIRRGLTLFSDLMARVFFDGQNEVTQHILRVITSQEDLVVTRTRVQVEVDNPFGRRIRLDVLAEDSLGKKYNIEIQRGRGNDLLARADYYGALIKTHAFKRRKSYSKVPLVYVIFVVEDGRFCDNKGINRYFVRDDSGKDFGIGTRIYFVNGRLRDDSQLGKIMHDMSCADFSAFKDQAMSKRINALRANPEEQKKMDLAEARWAKEIRRSARLQGREEGRMEGREEGRMEGREEAFYSAVRAKPLILQGLSDEDISKRTGLSLKHVQQLRALMEVD